MVRQKPDFTAVDGVSVATVGFSPFYGTSAAAPHAAAVAALVLEARADIATLSGSERTLALYEAFRATAIDIETPGYDLLTGHGILMADAALARCASLSDGAACSDGNECTSDDRCLDGACVAGEAVTCVALDACHSAGECLPATGECTSPALPVGTPCDDADACTTDDTCVSGRCSGQTVDCVAPDACSLARCDALSGDCVVETDPAADPAACSGGEGGAAGAAGASAGGAGGAGGAAASTDSDAGANGGGRPTPTDPGTTNAGDGGTPRDAGRGVVMKPDAGDRETIGEGPSASDPVDSAPSADPADAGALSTDESSAGCGCRVQDAEASRPIWLAGAGVLLFWRRRRPGRSGPNRPSGWL